MITDLVALNALTCRRQFSHLEVGRLAERHQERPTNMAHLTVLSSSPLYQCTSTKQPD